MSLTLKKIISEFGIFGLFRIPLILLSIIIFNIRVRTYRKDRKHLNSDIKKLKEKTLKDFQFLPIYDNDSYKSSFNWASNPKSDTRFYWTVKWMHPSLFYNLTEEEIEKVKNAIPNDREDEFYRFHPLNKGKNDQWEYYLVPWHRLMPFLTYYIWDDRTREHLLPLHYKLKEWYRNEFIWYDRIATGSNIYAINTGLAFQCLNEFLIDGDKKALKKYKRHLIKLKYFVDNAFDNGIAMEGNIYARFIFHSVYHLDQLHRYFDLDFKLIDDKLVDRYADYLETAWTVNNGFETSGDCHWEIDKLDDTLSFVYLSLISDRQIYKDILEYYPTRDYFNNSFYLNEDK